MHTRGAGCLVRMYRAGPSRAGARDARRTGDKQAS
eukprot:COSAG02_NODE_75_length_41389_cov_106.665762_11_plen_35_part_00